MLTGPRVDAERTCGTSFRVRATLHVGGGPGAAKSLKFENLLQALKGVAIRSATTEGAGAAAVAGPSEVSRQWAASAELWENGSSGVEMYRIK